jgi:hypothetical protein
LQHIDYTNADGGERKLRTIQRHSSRWCLHVSKPTWPVAHKVRMRKLPQQLVARFVGFAESIKVQLRKPNSSVARISGCDIA